MQWFLFSKTVIFTKQLVISFPFAMHFYSFSLSPEQYFSSAR